MAKRPRLLYHPAVFLRGRIRRRMEGHKRRRLRRSTAQTADFPFAFRNDTALFREAAEGICVSGLKAAHRLLLQDGFFAPSFPLYGFERKYSEGWLDEFQYLDLKDLSAKQSCHFYDSGLMVNGRYYSVESIPVQFPYRPLCSILEDCKPDKRYFLSAVDMERWQYLKGAKHELRHRKMECPISFPREQWRSLIGWICHRAPC